MKNNKFSTELELAILPQFLEEVLVIANEISEAVLQEEGCENFFIHRKKEMDNVLVIWAIYNSEEAYKLVQEQDYIKKFFGFLGDKLAGAPIITRLAAL